MVKNLHIFSYFKRKKLYLPPSWGLYGYLMTRGGKKNSWEKKGEGEIRYNLLSFSWLSPRILSD